MFLESIQLLYGAPQRLSYHQARVNNSLEDHFTQSNKIILNEIIDKHADANIPCAKLRMVYDDKGYDVEIMAYEKQSLSSLKVVHGDLKYDYKYADRSAIINLYEQKGNCSDIIIERDGLVTDTSYANIVLEKGGLLYTPAKPLLQGTRRQFLLDMEKIIPVDILVTELKTFNSIYLINSMLRLGDIMCHTNTIVI